jgi:hypothetical protein
MLREFLRNERGSCLLSHALPFGMSVASALMVAHEVRSAIEPLFSRVELALQAAALAVR